MTNNDIAYIIEELRELRKGELQILTELEETIRISRSQQSNQVQTQASAVPLHNNENRRVAHTPVVRSPTTSTHTIPTLATAVHQTVAPTNEDTDFQIGDRVYITNRLHRIRNRPPNKGDRISVVTGFLGERVYITTLNNFETWRISSNLRRARSDE
jgi:hypothetical protein